MTEAPATQDATAAPGIAPPEPEDRLRADTYRVLGRLLAARKVQVVGTIQRATGGTPAAIWSADV